MSDDPLLDRHDVPRMMNSGKFRIMFNCDDEEYVEDIIETLEDAFPEATFMHTLNRSLADFCLSQNAAKVDQPGVVIFRDVEDIAGSVAAHVAKGALFVPSDAARQALIAKVSGFHEHYEKLLAANAKHASTESLKKLDAIVSVTPANIHQMHKSSISRQLPELKRVLDRRFVKGLQRRVEGYTPIKPLIEELDYPEECKELFTFRHSDGHRSRIVSAAGALSTVGLEPPRTDLSYSQSTSACPSSAV